MEVKKKKKEFMISGFNQERDIESIVLKYEKLSLCLSGGTLGV